MADAQLALDFDAPQEATSHVKANRRYRKKLKARDESEIVSPAEKRCLSCGLTKSSSEFSHCKSEKDGLKRVCKQCAKEERRKRVESPGALVPEKRCSRCDRVRPAERFSKKSDSPDKLAPHCKDCERLRFKPWYEVNSSMVVDSARRWAEANPEMWRLSQQAHKQTRKERGALKLSARNWLSTLTYFDFRCAYCQRSEDEAGPMTVEHVLPLSRGGSCELDNIVPACERCNKSKNSKPLLIFVMHSAEYESLKRARAAS